MSGSDRASATPAPSTQEESQESKLSVPPKERRFKLSRACDRCRRRRIKCDEGHPCQSCIAADSACTFEEPGKRTHPKSKRAATLEDRMHHLESLIQSIPFSLFNAQAAGAGPVNPQLSGSTDPTGAHASLASATHAYPLGVPPPSLSIFPLMNPSTHFPVSNSALNSTASAPQEPAAPSDGIPKAADSNMNSAMPPGYLYLDDEGYTRWQGESSGLPLLDFLVERKLPTSSNNNHSESITSPVRENWSRKSEHVTTGQWFPDRRPRQSGTTNPESMWRLITGMIPAELMDNLVQCFLSTSYYLMPFLHVPTFLSDYGNPSKWGEPGFASFIVALCCLSSRHIDDIRVRADPADGFSAGAHWFELFTKLRTMPTADRPTLYTVQGVFVAAVYAIGFGRLSRGFALLAEACSLSIDAGLHRSSEAYDCFDPVEEQVRRRTFWCIYLWDKQAAAAFGRPPVLRLKDCDAREPSAVDDEYITAEAIGPQPEGKESRLGAFITCLRISVIFEAVLDSPPPPHPSSTFLQRVSSLLNHRGSSRKDLEAEEHLLNEILHSLPPFWAHTPETMGSPDVLRVTQAERIHCLALFVRMLISRSRFSWRVGERVRAAHEGSSGNADTDEIEQTAEERAAMMSCHSCAVELVHAHTQIAKKGLMTYYGVHVIHQLTQAGRSLIAVLLNCTTADLQPLVPASLEALRACIGLLRRFSGRYVCGLRSGELIEEFCRLTRIPLDAMEPQPMTHSQFAQERPPWIRPVRKKNRASSQAPDIGSGGSESSRHGSPADETTSPAPSAVSPTSVHNDHGSNAGGFHRLSASSPVSFNSGGRASHGDSLLADIRSSDANALGLGLTPAIIPKDLNSLGALGNTPNADEINSLGPMSPIDNMGIDGMSDMGMSSSALMSLLNDGSFDMANLFSGDFGMNAGTPISTNGDSGMTPMTGIVASP